MTIHPVHLLGSPVLRERSQPVGTVDDEVRQFVQDLFDTMEADQGIGLAANQVGVARQIAVVQTNHDDDVVLIDAEIVEREGSARGEEGCLSIPDLFADVDRAERIVVETTTLDNDRVRVEASDLCSRAIQHEVDHLDGILFLDRLSPLKRRLLLRKWKKSKWASMGLTKEVPTPKAGSRRF